MMFDSSNLIGAPAKDSHGKMTGFVNEVMVDSGGRALAVICWIMFSRMETDWIGFDDSTNQESAFPRFL